MSLLHLEAAAVGSSCMWGGGILNSALSRNEKKMRERKNGAERKGRTVLAACKEDRCGQSERPPTNLYAFLSRHHRRGFGLVHVLQVCRG